MTTDEEARAKVTELVRDAKICMFTTMTEDGRHLSRPMALQEAEFDGELWFFADEGSSVVHDIGLHAQVNVAFTNKDQAWVSIAGTAAVVRDRAKSEELWRPVLKAWFPEGIDTPGLVLIKLSADSAEYWDSPHGRVVTLIQYLASAALHRTPPVGENETVRLHD